MFGADAPSGAWPAKAGDRPARAVPASSAAARILRFMIGIPFLGYGQWAPTGLVGAICIAGDIRIWGWLAADWCAGADCVAPEEGWVGEDIDGGRGSPSARRISAISCICSTMISCAMVFSCGFLPYWSSA